MFHPYYAYCKRIITFRRLFQANWQKKTEQNSSLPLEGTYLESTISRRTVLRTFTPGFLSSVARQQNAPVSIKGRWATDNDRNRVVSMARLPENNRMRAIFCCLTTERISVNNHLVRKYSKPHHCIIFTFHFLKCFESKVFLSIIDLVTCNVRRTYNSCIAYI